MSGFTVTRGDGPIVLGMPHGGADLPEAVFARLNATGQALADTDWHIARLYEGLLPGATVVAATFHRYLIDANRDPAGASLYPGQNTTDLCPLSDFDGRPIWRQGEAPGADEIAERRERWHGPYHAALAAEVERARALHGVAILYDCHSIRSRIPFLFAGALPVFSIGTADGRACAPAVAEALAAPCRAAESAGLDHVVNGRFKGGWTTRRHGQPARGVHAVQMEVAQRAYLAAEAAPWTFCPAVAAPLRAVLKDALSAADRLARSGALAPSEESPHA